jgi:hypothetical protein
MAIDFLQVREQIKQLGENAILRDRRLKEKRKIALEMLEDRTLDLEELHQKVQLVVHNYDPNLRCALPVLIPGETAYSLAVRFPLPVLPQHATILAADGSQISPDRHAEVNFCLINVGAIQAELDTPDPPHTSVQSRLYSGDDLLTESGILTDARLALMRDLNERQRLVDLATLARSPVISFTDGPMELWGGRDGEMLPEFQKSLELYIDALEQLRALDVTTAGYVDKPGTKLVVRLLEAALTENNQLQDIKRSFPLRGLIDTDLYRDIIGPGERSAVFAIQFKFASNYQGDLALHFFYLNVGRTGHPWLARIEIPAWVANDRSKIDALHATLVQQCQIMGKLPYPYLLHRAHEAAVVSMEEKEQVKQMITQELRKRGAETGETSHKQASKDLGGRRSYSRGGKNKQ